MQWNMTRLGATKAAISKKKLQSMHFLIAKDLHFGICSYM
jgi:hypothetical protein